MLTYFYKKKKINFQNKKNQWGIWAIIILIILNILFFTTFIVKPNSIEQAAEYLFYITQPGFMLLITLFQEFPTGTLYPEMEDFPIRVGFVLTTAAYFWAGFGLKALIDFVKKRRE